MKTIIYKNEKEVCEIKHEGKKVRLISGCEKDKIEALLKNKRGRNYIWKDLLEFVDMNEGYRIETGEGCDL